MQNASIITHEYTDNKIKRNILFYKYFNFRRVMWNLDNEKYIVRCTKLL